MPGDAAGTFSSRACTRRGSHAFVAVSGEGPGFQFARIAVAAALMLVGASNPGLGQAARDSASETGGAEVAPLSASRPGNAESTTTVGRGVFQAEGGWHLARVGSENSYALGEVLLRYGVRARTELRVALNSYGIAVSDHARTRGLEDVAVGFKSQLLEGEGAMPSVALIASSTLPTGSRSFGAGRVQPLLATSAEWGLTDRLGLTATGGYESLFEDGARSGEASLAISLGYGLTDRLSGQVEYSRSAPAAGWRAGTPATGGALSYTLTDDLQFDAWAGAEFERGATTRLFGIGVARRW